MASKSSGDDHDDICFWIQNVLVDSNELLIEMDGKLSAMDLNGIARRSLH